MHNDLSFDPIAFADDLAARRAASIAESVARWRAWVDAELPGVLAMPDDALAAPPPWPVLVAIPNRVAQQAGA